MLNSEHLYTEKDLIRLINDEFGKNVLNRPMLAYMRDIRKLIPKPIRIHMRKRRGGAFSYYREDTLQLLRLIFKEKIHQGKNLKQIQIDLKDVIDQAVFNADLYREQIQASQQKLGQTMEQILQTMMAPSLEILKNFKVDTPNMMENIYIDQLEDTLKALRGKDDKEIDEALNSLTVMTRQIQKWRFKQKIAKEKEGKQEEVNSP